MSEMDASATPNSGNPRKVWELGILVWEGTGCYGLELRMSGCRKKGLEIRD